MTEPTATIDADLTRQLAMESYIALVNRCAENRLNQPISNGSPFHARVLISKLFEIARKRVQIVSGSMTDTTVAGVDIYGFEDVTSRARKFLRDPGATLSIVVESGAVCHGVDNRFFREIVGDRDRNGAVELLIAAPDGVSKSIPHFMVSDAYAYRYEPSDNVRARPDSTIMAVGNFGDEKFARNLAGYFDNLIAYLAEHKYIKGRCVFAPGQAFTLPA